MSDPAWTTPTQIDEQVKRVWLRGDLLREPLGDARYPLELPLRRPDTRALSDRFAEVQAWISALQAGSRARRGYGYDIVWTQVNNRVLGTNRVPQRVVVPTRDDALRLIGAFPEAESFARLAAVTLAEFPELREWIGRKPLTLLEHASAWKRVLSVLAWFRRNPRPRIYLRQLDIATVDTKFIESRKGLLMELLDVVLPATAIDASARGSRFFEQRYGLLSKPARIRFRLLDDRLFVGGFSDLAVPVHEFERAHFDVANVFITENDANGLAFPNVPCSIVIFGLGYGIDSLADAAWLASKRLYYWGDIDTHGFAMLDRLRRLFPHVTSLLMDRATLVAHGDLWTREGEPHRETLTRLSPAEGALYADLRQDRLGTGVRLEQERIAFGHLERALAELR
jgi:hypothetical protein